MRSLPLLAIVLTACGTVADGAPDLADVPGVCGARSTNPFACDPEPPDGGVYSPCELGTNPGCTAKLDLTGTISSVDSSSFVVDGCGARLCPTTFHLKLPGGQAPAILPAVLPVGAPVQVHFQLYKTWNGNAAQSVDLVVRDPGTSSLLLAATSESSYAAPRAPSDLFVEALQLACGDPPVNPGCNQPPAGTYSLRFTPHGGSGLAVPIGATASWSPFGTAAWTAHTEWANVSYACNDAAGAHWSWWVAAGAN